MSVNHRTVDFIAPVMVRDGVSMFPCRQREEFHGLRPDKQKPRCRLNTKVCSLPHALCSPTPFPTWQ